MFVCYEDLHAKQEHPSLLMHSIDLVNAQCWLFRFGCETTMIFFVYVVIPVFMKQSRPVCFNGSL